MKTTKRLLTILAVFAFVVIASAVEKPKMNVQSLNANQVLVTFQSQKASDMEVSIYDKEGTIVYYKLSSKPTQSFNKIFDIKNLENGNYLVQLTANGVILKRELEITSKKINVGNSEQLSAPYFTVNNKTLTISYLNFENKSYRLNIYNEEGLVYNTKIDNSSPLHSGFDLSKLESENYTVELGSGKNTFNYRFEN